MCRSPSPQVRRSFRLVCAILYRRPLRRRVSRLLGQGFLLLSLALSGPLLAQDRAEGSAAQPQTYRASALLDRQAENLNGQILGTVRDLVLDPEGRTRYVVLAYGGLFGFGAKLTAIPWQSLGIDLKDGHIIFNLSREVVARAPTFDRLGTDWMAAVDHYYAQQGTTGAAAPGGAFAALDRNRDGRISPAEAGRLIPLRRRFSNVDANGDGAISRSEFSAFERSR